MCGISGIFAFNEIGRVHMVNLASATTALAHRGPDAQGLFNDEFVGLGHRRLSIIDLSTAANQPMEDESGRYVLVYNGEIYNYLEIKKSLQNQGVNFTTSGDTEVLLQVLIHEGQAALPKLNGFFAFAFYDKQEQKLLIARDRVGIKPLYYFQDEDKLIFASELKSMMEFGIQKSLDHTALFTYLQLNYLPAPFSMIEGVKKLMPGQLLVVKKKELSVQQWYQLPHPHTKPWSGTYEEACSKLRELLTQSVHDRLVADVPLGTFLSGGIDSSIISTLAARETSQLHTFSIGYADNAYFDETKYAQLVADKIKSEHTVFSLSTEDLYGYLHQMLNSLSEPFADSSSLPVYALSQLTKQQVTVALSGDGADELFGGYNKHAGIHRLMRKGLKEKAVVSLSKIWDFMPKSRNNPITDRFRQLKRFADTAKLSFAEQYWFLASLSTEEQAARLMHDRSLENLSTERFEDWKQALLADMNTADLNTFLQRDMQLVLQGDMLPKVDLMSMAHALEVRVPFLDYRVIDFAFSLPTHYKVNGTMKKRILQDAFRADLPAELYKRPKHGFEVPLLNWLRKGLWKEITGDWLQPDYLEEQGVFDPEQVTLLLKKLQSNNPEDSHAQVWALIVFQQWWKNYLS